MNRNTNPEYLDSAWKLNRLGVLRVAPLDARRAKLSSRLTKERNNLNDGFAV